MEEISLSLHSLSVYDVVFSATWRYGSSATRCKRPRNRAGLNQTLSLQRDVEKEKRARQEVSIYLGKEVPLVIPSHPSARLLRQRAVTETHRCTSLGMSSK